MKKKVIEKTKGTTQMKNLLCKRQPRTTDNAQQSIQSRIVFTKPHGLKAEINVLIIISPLRIISHTISKSQAQKMARNKEFIVVVKYKIFK